MSYPSSMVSRDIYSDEVLFIIVAKSFDRSHAMLASSLKTGNKSADTIAHLNLGLSLTMKEQLSNLGQGKKCLALIGHLMNNTMGEYKIAELASTLAKDLPQRTKQPLPIVFFGCAPEYINHNGEIENSAAELVIELDKQKINATCFAISPSSIQYKLSDNSLSSQWHITQLFCENKSGRWMFRGVPECNAQAYEACKGKLESLSINLTQLKQQSDSIIKKIKSIENDSSYRKTIEESAALKQENSLLFHSLVSLMQQRDALLMSLDPAQANSTQQVDSTKKALIEMIRPLAELSRPLLHKREVSPDDIDYEKINIKSLASSIRIADDIEHQIDKISVKYQENKRRIALLDKNLAKELQQQISPLNEILKELTEEIKRVSEDISDCKSKINQTYVDMLAGDSPMQLITTQYKLSSPKDFPGIPGSDHSNLMIQKPSVEIVSVREITQPIDVTPVSASSQKYQPPNHNSSLNT